MRAVRILLPVTTACALLVVACGDRDGGVLRPAATGPSSVVAQDVGAAANQELAAARAATAKYHDLQQALDDGFIPLPNACIPGEGIHYRAAAARPDSAIDCTFDPVSPEVLHYVPKQNGELQLVGVEYLVRRSASCGTQTTPPAGFSGDADEWEPEIGGTVWALNAWIWQGVPDGVFAFRSDKITCD